MIAAAMMRMSLEFPDVGHERERRPRASTRREREIALGTVQNRLERTWETWGCGSTLTEGVYGHAGATTGVRRLPPVRFGRC